MEESKHGFSKKDVHGTQSSLYSDAHDPFAFLPEDGSAHNLLKTAERPSVDPGYVRVHDLDGSKRAMRNIMRKRKRELVDLLHGEGLEIVAEEVPSTPDIGTLTLKEALRSSQVLKDMEFPYIEQPSPR